MKHKTSKPARPKTVVAMRAFVTSKLGDEARPVSEPALAPWPDFAGQPIKHGARLRHPADGTEFVAVRLKGFADEGDAWRCIYDHDPQSVSRLCLQIGDKGQAVVIE